MREILRDARGNGLLLCVRMLILGLLLTLIYQVAAFAQVSQGAIARSFGPEAEVEMYAITDTLDDPEAFSRFRASAADVETVAQFYNALNTLPGVDFLSVFDQPVPVEDFRGGERFDATYGEGRSATGQYRDVETGKLVTDVKSFQLNEQAWQFHSLQVERGEAIDFSRVDYSTGQIPVVLGAEYAGVYDIGDTLPARFYFTDVELVVAGILEPDSSIYYRGEISTFLDDSIIIPYPPRLGPVEPADLFFTGILSFAMIGGEIAAPTGTSAAEVLDLVGAAAARSGFDSYTVMGAPTYLVQYQLMRTLITDNAGLLTGLGVLLGMGVMTINGLMSLQLVRRRWQVMRVRWLIGHTPEAITTGIIRLVVAEYAVLAAVVVIAVLAVPHSNLITGGWVLACLAGACAADAAAQALLTAARLRRASLSEERA